MVADQRSNFSMMINFAFAIRYNIERLNSFRGPALIGTLSQVAASVSDGPSLAEYAAIRTTEHTKYEPDPTSSKIYENLYTEWRHKERLLLSYYPTRRVIHPFDRQT